MSYLRKAALTLVASTAVGAYLHQREIRFKAALIRAIVRGDSVCYRMKITPSGVSQMQQRGMFVENFTVGAGLGPLRAERAGELFDNRNQG